VVDAGRVLGTLWSDQALGVGVGFLLLELLKGRFLRRQIIILIFLFLETCWWWSRRSAEVHLYTNQVYNIASAQGGLLARRKSSAVDADAVLTEDRNFKARGLGTPLDNGMASGDLFVDPAKV